jgi:fatty acid desaturase
MAVLSRGPSVTPVSDPPSVALQRRVNALRHTDNLTNWFYLARECLLLGLVVGLAIVFYHSREAWGLAWLWNVPVTLLAVVLVGAGQHRLTTLAHEASHYMLFRNRLLNELASDWFCMFPMWSTTHGYRLQHLAHHQYVNDPERDPDVTQMQASGHRFHFPMARGRFVWECVVKQFLWLPNLIRYIRIRAQYASTGSAGGPYQVRGGNRSPLLTGVGILYLAILAGSLVGLVLIGNPWLLALVPAVLWAATMAFFLGVPDAFYRKSLVKPDVHPRWTSAGRLTFTTAVFTSLAWLTYQTGEPWALYYFLLWLLPIGTTFSFFMILRQIVQHGNAGEDRLTNTRIFHVGRLIQLAVFPLGMDYHLPHHMYPMVPHHRLRQLHALLLGTEAYRRQATLVDGYFFHHERPPVHPTVLDLMAEPRPQEQPLA